MLSAIGMGLRLRSIVLLTLLLLLVIGVLYSLKSHQPFAELQHIDFIQARKSFVNPIYQKWAPKDRLEKLVLENCILYFNEFQSGSTNLPSFGDLMSYQFSPLLYKKSKWIAEEKKHFRRVLREKGIQLDDSHMPILENRFNEETRILSRFERAFAQNSASLRLFGKCYLTESTKLDDRSCKQIMSRLLPALLGNLPSVESWESNVVKEDAARQCVVESIKEKMKGKGIVIPLLPKQDLAKQTLLVARLIHVLRATQNTLPIEIVYVEEGEINKQRKELLISAARDLTPKLPSSTKSYLEAYDILLTFELPQQDIRFINLRPAISKNVPVTDSLVWILSTVYNSFEELILLSPHTIPLLENLAVLFDNEQYASLGTFFFKHRSLLSYKPHKFPSGFFEVNNLVNEYGGPQNDDFKYFKLSKSKQLATRWVRELGFTKLLDPSLAVINKKKTLSGLLLATTLPFYTFLQPKYDFTGELNPEILWLGIEMAGGSVHFNKNSAAIAGILTPPENTPPGMLSRELCSSSWAQIHEDEDAFLVYVTSNQLENKVLPEFAPAIFNKLTSTVEKKGVKHANVNKIEGQGSIDDELVLRTVKRNLLFIETALQPVAVEKPDAQENDEPSSPWYLIDGFGSANDYWCAYDIIGSIELPTRGLLINFSEKVMSRFLFLFDIWLQTPQRV